MSSTLMIQITLIYSTINQIFNHFKNHLIANHLMNHSEYINIKQCTMSVQEIYERDITSPHFHNIFNIDKIMSNEFIDH